MHKKPTVDEEDEESEKTKEVKEGFAPYSSQYSVKNMLTNELKYPLLQVLLYVLLNLDSVNVYLYKYIPMLFTSSRDLNIRGIVVKAVVLALLYYLITTFGF